MVDARWQFFLIMRYHNHGFVLAATEGFDDVFYKTAVAVVESVERLIENQQFRILDKGTCQENEALFAAGELQEPRSSRPSSPKTFIQKRHLSISSSFGFT